MFVAALRSIAQASEPVALLQGYRRARWNRAKTAHTAPDGALPKFLAHTRKRPERQHELTADREPAGFSAGEDRTLSRAILEERQMAFHQGIAC